MLSCRLTCWRTNPAQQSMVDAGRGASVRLAAAVCHKLPFQISASPALIPIGLPSGYGGDGCSAQRCEPGTTCVAPLSAVKSHSSINALHSSGCGGRGSGCISSSQCNRWATAPGSWLLVVHHDSRQSRLPCGSKLSMRTQSWSARSTGTCPGQAKPFTTVVELGMAVGISRSSPRRSRRRGARPMSPESSGRKKVLLVPALVAVVV